MNEQDKIALREALVEHTLNSLVRRYEDELRRCCASVCGNADSPLGVTSSARNVIEAAEKLEMAKKIARQLMRHKIDAEGELKLDLAKLHKEAMEERASVVSRLTENHSTYLSNFLNAVGNEFRDATKNAIAPLSEC